MFMYFPSLADSILYGAYPFANEDRFSLNIKLEKGERPKFEPKIVSETLENFLTIGQFEKLKGSYQCYPFLYLIP